MTSENQNILKLIADTSDELLNIASEITQEPAGTDQEVADWFVGQFDADAQNILQMARDGESSHVPNPGRRAVGALVKVLWDNPHTHKNFKTNFLRGGWTQESAISGGGEITQNESGYSSIVRAHLEGVEEAYRLRGDDNMSRSEFNVHAAHIIAENKSLDRVKLGNAQITSPQQILDKMNERISGGGAYEQTLFKEEFESIIKGLRG